MPRFTFGFPFSSDPGGWYTLNAFLLYHPHLRADCEIVIVDNSKPGCPISTEFEKQTKSHPEVRYIRDPGPPSSCLYKERLFREAKGDVVICVDAHVLLNPGAVDAILDYFELRTRDCKDLITGVLQNAAGHVMATNQHLFDSEPYPLAKDTTVRHGYVCRGGQLGTWVKDERGLDPKGDPYEIQMNGSWLLAMRREHWPGFHPFSTGFGGNEPFIYRKVQLKGGRVLTHPAVRGVHNFASAHGKGYSPLAEDKIRNYLVAALTLQDDALYKATIEHFSTIHPRSIGGAIQQAQLVMEGKHQPRKHDTTPGEKVKVPVEPAKKPGIYQQYIEPWKQQGGDVGGACPEPLFVSIVHIKPMVANEDGTERPRRTLEFGCGLSTLGFDRQGTVHTAIEHDAKWAGRMQRALKETKVKLIHAPINPDTNWYDWKPKYGDLYDVILIDGPPGTIGREGCLKVVPEILAPGGIIYVDDTHREVEKKISAELAEKLGLVAYHKTHGKRAFDILAPPPEPLGEGPGTELVSIFKANGFPACQQCMALARRMNQWDIAGCEQRFEEIVADILPRAVAWTAARHPWALKLLGTVGADEAALKVAIRTQVRSAITAAQEKTLQQAA